MNHRAFGVMIRKAFDSQQSLISTPEHCSIDGPTFRQYDLVVGQQLRVSTPVGTALFTLTTVVENDPSPSMRIGKTGRARVSGGAADVEATASTLVLDQSMSDQDADTYGGLVERLHDDGGNRWVVIAPHGGDIEHGTDEQARYVQRALPGSVSWICKGHRQGGGAHSAWHITSTDLSPHSFPLLDTIMPRRFHTAVSFHGHAGDTVIVGGRAPIEILSKMRDAIARALVHSNVPVILANGGALAAAKHSNVLSTGGALSGSAAANIVNRLTDGYAGGIQIEQSLKVRSTQSMLVASAVVEVLVGIPGKPS